MVLALVPVERSRCVQPYPLPWNTTSTLGAATNAQYFYDYAAQDPINNYDLSGDLLAGLRGRIAACGLGAAAVLCSARQIERMGFQDAGEAGQAMRLRREAQNLRNAIARDDATPAEVRRVLEAESRIRVEVNGVRYEIRLKWNYRSAREDPGELLEMEVFDGGDK